MNQIRISPQRYGFAPLPGGNGQMIYCTHCLKVLASARLTDMRNHHGSSYCAFRIATGIAAAEMKKVRVAGRVDESGSRGRDGLGGHDLSRGEI